MFKLTESIYCIFSLPINIGVSTLIEVTIDEWPSPEHAYSAVICVNSYVLPLCIANCHAFTWHQRLLEFHFKQMHFVQVAFEDIGHSLLMCIPFI